MATKKKTAKVKKPEHLVPPLQPTEESFADLARRLAQETGYESYVSDDGTPTTPLTAQEHNNGATSKVVAADVLGVAGCRILVRIDDPDTGLGDMLAVGGKQAVKQTGVIIKVAPAAAKRALDDGIVLAPGVKIVWPGSRSSDFPSHVPGADKMVFLRYPEEALGTVQERVQVRRPTGAIEEERRRLLKETEGSAGE